jgi:hypothetical protein
LSFLSRNEYTGNGSTTDYTVSFPYLQTTHVKVYVSGLLQTITTNYSWVNSTTIRFVTAPAISVSISIRRDTSSTVRLVDYVSGSSLNEDDLDTDSLQAFYLSQEGIDRAPSNPVREKLTANRTYYVRTDGSDSNDGLSNTAAGAFKTIQRAVDIVAATIDLGKWDVTIKVGAGTYTAGFDLEYGFTGGGSVSVEGDVTTPSNVNISVTGGTAFFLQFSTVFIRGFKITNVGSGSAVYAFGSGTQIYIDGKMEFHGGPSSAIVAEIGSTVNISGDLIISGSYSDFIDASANASVYMFSATVTLTGTPAFSDSFASAYIGGSFASSGVTFVGSATGARYNVHSNGVIYTFGSGATYLPGNSAGVTATGGQYA